jgi:hypothetical protein
MLYHTNVGFLYDFLSIVTKIKATMYVGLKKNYNPEEEQILPFYCLYNRKECFLQQFF